MIAKPTIKTSTISLIIAKKDPGINPGSKFEDLI